MIRLRAVKNDRKIGWIKYKYLIVMLELFKAIG